MLCVHFDDKYRHILYRVGDFIICLSKFCAWLIPSLSSGRYFCVPIASNGLKSFKRTINFLSIDFYFVCSLNGMYASKVYDQVIKLGENLY